jgi:hypothetical protein
VCEIWILELGAKWEKTRGFLHHARQCGLACWARHHSVSIVAIWKIVHKNSYALGRRVTQQRTEQLVQIFRRLVAAKLTGSLSVSARAYSDLDTLADHVAIVQEQQQFRRPGRVTRPARAGLKAAPVSAPMRMLKT